MDAHTHCSFSITCLACDLSMIRWICVLVYRFKEVYRQCERSAEVSVSHRVPGPFAESVYCGGSLRQRGLRSQTKEVKGVIVCWESLGRRNSMMVTIYTVHSSDIIQIGVFDWACLECQLGGVWTCVAKVFERKHTVWIQVNSSKQYDVQFYIDKNTLTVHSSSTLNRLYIVWTVRMDHDKISV